MTPRQARAARAMLGLDLKSVCELAVVGKRTLTEFEAGTRSVNAVTLGKIVGFYISRGISFDQKIDAGESVSLLKNSIIKRESKNHTSEKFEYFDIFEIDMSLDEVDEMLGLCAKVGNRTKLSQSIMIHMIKKTGLEQNKIASMLGFTPSFVSAIVTGKKKIPLNRAEKIQTYFDGLFDVTNVLYQESLLIKYFAEVNESCSRLISIMQEIKSTYINPTRL